MMNSTARRALDSERTSPVWASCWGIQSSLGVSGAELAAHHRHATSEDVPEICKLLDIAGDGLPLNLWTNRSGEGDPLWDVAIMPSSHRVDGFALDNMVVREDGGKLTACLIGYPLRNAAPAISRDTAPAMIATLQQLEDIVPNSWFVSALATLPEYRRRGFGTRLLGVAEALASDSLCASLSLIVSRSNTRARRLCKKNGYREQGWQDWVLLVMDL